MLVINESFIDVTTETRLGDSGWYEPFTDDVGRLYRSLQSEYGRCTGHVYIDTGDGETVPVGWVFVGRVEYDGAGDCGFLCDRTYLREVWVSVGERDDESEDRGVYPYDVKRHESTRKPHGMHDGVPDRDGGYAQGDERL